MKSIFTSRILNAEPEIIYIKIWRPFLVKQHALPLKEWITKGLTIALVLTLISTAFIFFNSSSSAKNVMNWGRFNFLAFFFACLALLGSWLIEAVRIYLITAGLGERVPLRRILGINLATMFSGNITPFYSGGVPTQIYLLCRNGIAPGKASAIVTLRIIFSTLVFTITVPFLLLFYHARFSMGIIHQATTVAIPIAFLASAIMIGFIVNPKIAKLTFAFFIRKFQSFKFFQRLLPLLERLLEELESFHEAIQQFRRGINLYLVILCSFLYWALFFMIAPFVMFALGINIVNLFWEIILFQFILVFIVSYLPIPGGSGVMELSFYSLLAFIPANLRAIFVLFWRFLSYYISTFIGGVVLLRLIKQPAPPAEALN